MYYTLCCPQIETHAHSQWLSAFDLALKKLDMYGNCKPLGPIETGSKTYKRLKERCLVRRNRTNTARTKTAYRNSQTTTTSSAKSPSFAHSKQYENMNNSRKESIVTFRYLSRSDETRAKAQTTRVLAQRPDIDHCTVSLFFHANQKWKACELFFVVVVVVVFREV